MGTTLYGISNCDTVRKARRWLESNDIAYKFHDLRLDPVKQNHLGAWVSELGWEQVVNRRSATWRSLDVKDKQDLTEKSAIALLSTHPTLIRRPVLETPDGITTGFDIKQFSRLLGME